MAREEVTLLKDGEGGSRIEREQEKLSTELEKCPRCDSTNTKFCYFNNYSLSQPRYYCKDCKRYWTKGGALRNIPVGGKPRRVKRSRRSPSAATVAHQAQAQLLSSPFNQPMNQQVHSNESIDIASLFVSQPNAIPPTPPLNNNALSIRGFGRYHGYTAGLQGMGNGNLAADNNRLPPTMNALTFQQPLPLQQRQQQRRPAASGPSTVWSTIVHWNGQGAPGGDSNN